MTAEARPETQATPPYTLLLDATPIARIARAFTDPAAHEDFQMSPEQFAAELARQWEKASMTIEGWKNQMQTRQIPKIPREVSDNTRLNLARSNDICSEYRLEQTLSDGTISHITVETDVENKLRKLKIESQTATTIGDNGRRMITEIDLRFGSVYCNDVLSSESLTNLHFDTNAQQI